jgi:diaminopimelate decarboxylase
MIDNEQLREIATREIGDNDSGVIVYDLAEMARTAESLQAAELPYGLTVRYAFKANTHPEIIDLFKNLGLSFETGTVEETPELLKRGVEGSAINMSPKHLEDGELLRGVLDRGVVPAATKLRHIGILGRMRKEFGFGAITLRPNPGEGSGTSPMTTTGSTKSPFGIWKDDMPQALKLADDAGLTVDRLHIHVGSGADPEPERWQKMIQNSLDLVEQCPDVTTLNMGGGYKIARMEDEESADMDEIFGVFAQELKAFADRTGRKIHLEIEPGSLLVGNAAKGLTEVKETNETPAYKQLIVGLGMTAFLRIVLYGARHRMEILNDSSETEDYAVFGPLCEPDLLTPAQGNPKKIEPRQLKVADVGDILAIGGAGAYCMSMALANYCGIRLPQEVFVESAA